MVTYRISLVICDKLLQDCRQMSFAEHAEKMEKVEFR